jgi:hypothetical protein
VRTITHQPLEKNFFFLNITYDSVSLCINLAILASLNILLWFGPKQKLLQDRFALIRSIVSSAVLGEMMELPIINYILTIQQNQVNFRCQSTEFMLQQVVARG